MSRNGTMESAVSNQHFQQQQQNNLQQLQQLEQNVSNYQAARSLTSNERGFAPDISINDQLQQQTQAHGHTNSLGSSSRGLLQQHPGTIRNSSASQPQQSSKVSDPRNPFSVTIPINSNPTDVLAGRFAAWRQIIASLLQYLNETASIQDEIVRQQVRLSNAVNFQFNPQDNRKPGNHSNNNNNNGEIFQSNFFLPQGSGSIQDLPNALIGYHSTSANLASKTSKELNGTIIPRLEELRRELLIKIKEIKSLNSDFKNNVSREMNQTKQELQNYYKSIEDAKYHHGSIQPKNDPYLTKIILDRQIKKQLLEENYLHEAYINLQSSGKELEKVVVVEIQNALTVYCKLLGEQAQNIFDKLISTLDYGFLTKNATFEWDQFIAKDKNFIDENLPKRDYKKIVYDRNHDPFTCELRSSFLERRSKFLKSYSRGFYVLTPTFFHEFKSSDRKRDLIPVMSLPLDDIELEDYSKKDSNQNKFVLKKVGKLSSHKFIFRADNYDLMLSWYEDIKNLKSLSDPLQRANYVAKNQTKEAASEELSRVTTTNSRAHRTQSVYDSSHETDTMLSMALNNQALPQQSSSPMPQQMVNNSGVFVKQVNVSSQLSQQQSQQSPRFSLPYPTTPLQGTSKVNGYVDQGSMLRHSLDSQRGINGNVNVVGTGIDAGDGTLISEDTIKSAKKETYTE